MPKIVTFSGLDGAGKSTHVELTAEFLIREGYSVKIIAPKNLTLFQLGKKALSYFSPLTVKEIDQDQIQYSQKSSLRIKALGSLKRICSLADLLIFFIYTRVWVSRRVEFIVCDRYFFDFLVHLQYLKMCGKTYSSLYLHLIPPTLASFFMDVSPETAFARKPEHPENLYVEKGRLYQTVSRMKGLTPIYHEDINACQSLIEKKLEKSLT